MNANNTQPQKEVKKVRQLAVDLYVWYLREGAPRRVNIPSDIKSKIDSVFLIVNDHIQAVVADDHSARTTEHSIFENTTSKSATSLTSIKFPADSELLNSLPLADDIFDTAQTTVLDMILNEPFIRFVESDTFKMMTQDQKNRTVKSAKQTRRKKLNATRPIQFSDLYHNLDLFQVFENFLKKEFSEEYLYFWAKLVNFGHTKDSIAVQAHAIYNQYIAGEKVTVSITECESLKNRIDTEHVDRRMFEFVRLEIEAILKTKFSDALSMIQSEMKKIKSV
jgi:hypothetical protein